MLLRPYSERARFTLRTDHHTLRWILNLADATIKFGRWRLGLVKFGFKIVHRAVVEHHAAHTLCRLPTNSSDHTSLGDDRPFMVVTPSNKKVINSQRNDAAVGSHAEINSTFRNYRPRLLELFVTEQVETYGNHDRHDIGSPNTTLTYDKDELLLRKTPIEGTFQKELPASLCTRVFKLAQYSLFAGHPAEPWMYDQFGREFH